MVAYCQLRGIRDQDSINDLLYIIPRLDHIYLEKFYSDQEKERKKAEQKSSQGTRRAR